MSNPYQDMCAALIGELHEYKVAHPNHGTDIIDRARTLLGTADQTRRYTYNPVQIAECGGPCEQGSEHCDCGALWDDGNPAPQPEPPLPISAHDLAIQWNQQADADDQWESLDLYGQLAWAQSRAIAADRARRPTPDTESLRSALRECGRAVGSLISNECSDDFLLQVPAEVRLAFTRSVSEGLLPVPGESITVTTVTLEQVLGALEVGLEAAEGEHSDAVLRDGERRPLRVKWYAEQVELIAAAIDNLRRDTGRTKPSETIP